MNRIGDSAQSIEVQLALRAMRKVNQEHADRRAGRALRALSDQLEELEGLLVAIEAHNPNSITGDRAAHALRIVRGL